MNNKEIEGSISAAEGRGHMFQSCHSATVKLWARGLAPLSLSPLSYKMRHFIAVGRMCGLSARAPSELYSLKPGKNHYILGPNHCPSPGKDHYPVTRAGTGATCRETAQAMAESPAFG